jgi:integrase
MAVEDIAAKRRKYESRQLTERGIERMKPPPKPKQGAIIGTGTKPRSNLTIFDSGQKGLVLNVSYGGTKSFSVAHYPVKGGPARYFKLGNFHPEGVGEEAFPDPSSGAEMPRYLTLAGARRAALLFRTKPAAFLDPKKTDAPQTFRAVAEEYLEWRARKASFRSLPEAKRMLEKHVYPALGDRPFLEIKRSDVIALKDDVGREIRARHKKQKSIVTVNGDSQADAVLSLVRTIMRYFEAHGKHDGYACPSNLTLSANRASRDRKLSIDEIKLVWDAAGKLGPYGAMVKLLLLTAQRRDKVSTMRWSDLDGDVWTIFTEPKEKGNAGRVRLSPLAMSIIGKIDKLAGCPYVFAGRYGEKSFNSFSQGMVEMRKLLPDDMPRWTLHDLRRTSRTMMSKLRIDPRTAEMVLGHALPGIEGTYNLDDYFEPMSEALLTLSGHIQQIVDPAGGNVVTLARR